MTQTDVNNAFYFILPSVSTQLLLREGVEVPDDLLHYLMCHRDFRSWLWVFLGLFFSADA